MAFGNAGLGQFGQDESYANAKSSDGALGNFASAYMLDKTGISGMMNSNAPAGYEFSGGSLRKQQIGVPPASGMVVPTMSPSQMPAKDDDIDPRAHQTLGMTIPSGDTKVSQVTQPTSAPVSPVAPSTSEYAQGGGGGGIMSLLKLLG